MKLPISYADAIKKIPELFFVEMSNDAIKNANNMLTLYHIVYKTQIFLISRVL